MMRALIAVVFVLGQTTVLPAQFQRYPTSLNPDPKQRRWAREQAVYHAGNAARPLVESAFGDEAALALLHCSPTVGARLVAFHDAGGLSRICSPEKVLLAIAQPSRGDSVCDYVITHEKELADPDCCEAFLHSPLDFGLRLKQIQTAAEERRAGRAAHPPAASVPIKLPTFGRDQAVAIGLVGLFALLIWAKRRQSARGGPA